MDEQKIDMYIMTHQKYFPAEKMVFLKEKLRTADSTKFALASSVELKDPMIIFIVSLFLGSLGIDRFMLGDIGMGILKLLTCGLCGLLTIIDWFLVMQRAKEANFSQVMAIL